MQVGSSAGFPGDTSGKELLVNAGDVRDMGSIPELRRFPGEGNGNPLHYASLENPTERRAWQATQSVVSQKSQTHLSH